MGYFSLGLAELVGEEGRVISADVQDEMLTGLRKRAGRAGLLPRIQIHQAGSDRVGVEGPVDFVLAFWMVHEVRDQAAFLQEIYDLLKQGGRFLIAEPNVHVSGRAFDEMISLGKAIGFHSGGRPRVRASRAVLFQK
jgi:ubiquinone/menaquinone biosynthesis C-methylase UbiE